MRYFNTERLGVIATDRIVTKDIGWIFREQPICDVGIDALIEQVELNNPKGKFIALQIKSGEGNFHSSDETLTYYASNIHADYWLNLNIPILLIAHLPVKEETYGCVIDNSTLKKTKNRWKIEISTKRKFDANSKTDLVHLLSNQNQKPYHYFKSIFDDKLARYNLFTGNIDDLYTENTANGVFRFLRKLDTGKLAAEVASALAKIKGEDTQLLLIEDSSASSEVQSLTLEANGAQYIVINGNLNLSWKNFAIIHSLVQTYLNLGELSSSKESDIMDGLKTGYESNPETGEALLRAISIIVAPKDRALVYEIGRTLTDDPSRPIVESDLAESYEIPEIIIRYYREKIEKDIFNHKSD